MNLSKVKNKDNWKRSIIMGLNFTVNMEQIQYNESSVFVADFEQTSA